MTNDFQNSVKDSANNFDRTNNFDSASPPTRQPSAARVIEGETFEPPAAVASFSQSPHRLIIRHQWSQLKSDYNDLLAIWKAQIVQDGIRRDEEHRHWENNQLLQLERQEAKAKRHSLLREIIMMMICSGVQDKARDME